MMQTQSAAVLPPLYRDIKRLLKMVEETVRGFSRYQQYAGKK